MPATRSQADAAAGGAEPEVADLLEDAAAELSADPAVRGTVSADEVTWAKDAKATGKLLAASFSI